jgi:hypothetical protein
MSVLSKDNLLLEVTGLVHEIDPARRELTLLVEDRPEHFDLAPECVLVLRRERVKLRLLQPHDCARVCYVETPQGRVARSIRVD